MANLAVLQATWAPRVLSVLRIMSALLFIEHGTMKLFGFPAAMPGMEGGLPPMLMAAAILEIGGGVLLAIGLFTRPVAFILSGMMAVAYFLAHAPQGFFPVLNQGEGAILFCFIFFYLAFAGGGCWSIDAVRGEKTSAA
ncbi:MAG: DoxX family protein [Rhodospirillaceae bacterium]|nr:DoxX family protein [Rhodospirillaceae bacterium]